MLETELKLLLNPTAAAAVLEHALIKQYQVGEVQHKKLISTYFDTAGFTLAEQKAILRVREVHQADNKISYIQTLKTAAEEVVGLQQRQEWEAEVAGLALDFNKLPVDLTLVEQLQEIGADKFTAVFTTEFNRKIIILQTPTTKIELALDEGKIFNAQHSEELCELELELLEGEVAGLFAVALQLSKDLPLTLSVLNKAERGYQLLRPVNYNLQKSKLLVWVKAATAKTTIYEGVCFIYSQLLMLWQNADKVLRTTKKAAAALAVLLEVLPRLQNLLSLVPALWPRRVTQTIRQDLVWLKESLQDKKPAEALEILLDARYTQLWLQLCDFIVAKPWAADLDEAAQKQSQKLLVGWAKALIKESLPALIKLKKEVQAVPVAQICDQLVTAQKLRAYAEWFLGLYNSDEKTIAAFFTVLCQLEAALEELTKLHLTKTLDPKALPQIRTHLGRKLTELLDRFEGL